MTVALTVYEGIPFFGIIGYDQKVVKFSEFGKFVCNGIDFAFVFVFDCFHLCVKFRLLVDPEAAELFKEAYFIFLLKSVYNN